MNSRGKKKRSPSQYDAWVWTIYDQKMEKLGKLNQFPVSLQPTPPGDVRVVPDGAMRNASRMRVGYAKQRKFKDKSLRTDIAKRIRIDAPKAPKVAKF